MIGRKKEIELLNKLYYSNEAQFVAVYGRRRIGKTYLINEVFQNRFAFKHAGLSPIENETNKDRKNPLKQQLKSFYSSLILSGMKPKKCPKDWMEAFLMLELYLQSIDVGQRLLIFIDELPWLDTPKSGFISAFEFFWNNWACARKNIMLIVCGSATSWMNDKLINNHGGLYNRITYEIKLKPFTLKECEEYFLSKNIRFSRYDIASSYMICGGTPYYLSYFSNEFSLAQNIDNLFFKNNAPLRSEFDRLFNSIFTNPEFMKSIIKVVGKKRVGCTRKEIIESLKVCSNKKLTDALNSLISSDFLIKYIPFGFSKREEHYKLIDPFTNFYLKFIENKNEISEDFWLTNLSNQSVVSWRGIAFENICFNHIKQIKYALGISGISTEESSWYKFNDEADGAQIDMLIKRNDNVINMCEIKFYDSELLIDKKIDQQIRNRIAVLEALIHRKYAIRSTLITTFGLKRNEYSSIFSNLITLDDLFKE